MKKIICSFIIVLSLNIFGLGALNKNIAQDNEFTKEEQYLIDNGHSMFAEDIRRMRLGNSETHGTTYENLIKFANELLLSEVKGLFYEEKEENSFTVVTTNTLGYVPIEEFIEAATKIIAGTTGSIREDYAPGNSNNLDIYVRYNTINAGSYVMDPMLNNESGAFSRYISEMGVMYGNSEYDIAMDLFNRYSRLQDWYVSENRDWSNAVDMTVIHGGNIPGTNNQKYIEVAYLLLRETLDYYDRMGEDEEVDELLTSMNNTVKELPLGVMYHNTLGWTFVVLELTDRDALNILMNQQFGGLVN